MMSSSTSSDKKWKRPTDVAPFPQIWRRLTIRNKNTGESYNIRIQDIPSDRHDEVWDMFRENFYTDEPVHHSLNMSADKESMLSAKRHDCDVLTQNLSIIAVLDNEDSKPTILGGLMLKMSSKYDPPHEPTNPAAKVSCKIESLITWIRKDDNLFEKLETDYLLKENDLVVKREYRGMGLGLELFRTVECIAKAFGIPAMAVLFSHPASKKIGTTLGMTLLKEGRLVDCVDESGQKVFPDTDPERTLISGYIKYDI